MLTKGKEVAASMGRLQELEQAYDTLGVKADPAHRFCPGLDDSQLHTQKNIEKLTEILAERFEIDKIGTVITPGWQGFDGHSDHIAVHLACVLAAKHSLVKTRVIGLNAEGGGSMEVGVDITLKRSCLNHHKSQITQTIDSLINAHPAYKRLMEKETYDYCDSPDDIDRAKQMAMSLTQRIP